MQISKKQKKREKMNEIMINIAKNVFFLSLSRFVSFGMNDDRKKQTERHFFFFAT